MGKRSKMFGKSKSESLLKSFFRICIIETLIPAGIIALFIITFVAQLYKIPSGSMIPTLKVGDRILVAKFTYGVRIPFSGKWCLGRRSPERGDVVVFLFDKDIEEERSFIKKIEDWIRYRKPWNKKRNFIKRIIGTPGDQVEIKEGNIYINGELIDDPVSIPRERFYYNGDNENMFYTEGDIVIPDNNYFVLGDNSANSKDSRYWGLVSKEKLKGKALLIIWPLGRMGSIH